MTYARCSEAALRTRICSCHRRGAPAAGEEQFVMGTSLGHATVVTDLPIAKLTQLPGATG
jgi:hypothetical protein